MHRTRSDTMEEQADRFASEFLMPLKDIKEDLSDLTFYKLAELKKKWKVSMSALIYRAKSLETITDNQARYLWMQLSKNGWSKNEPKILEPLKESPSLIMETVEVVTGDKYNEAALERFINLSKEDIHYFFYQKSSLKPKSYLRLVAN